MGKSSIGHHIKISPEATLAFFDCALWRISRVAPDFRLRLSAKTIT